MDEALEYVDSWRKQLLEFSERNPNRDMTELRSKWVFALDEIYDRILQHSGFPNEDEYTIIDILEDYILEMSWQKHENCMDTKMHDIYENCIKIGEKVYKHEKERLCL